MPKFKIKSTNEVDALQFTGGNWATMQNHVGSHNLDPAGNYTVPNFDHADTWWPERPDKDVTAVLYRDGEWTGVRPSEWILKSAEGSLYIVSNDEFVETYEQV